jgi:hypothetical protein
MIKDHKKTQNQFIPDPDPGGKKSPDPGSGSPTLANCVIQVGLRAWAATKFLPRAEGNLKLMLFCNNCFISFTKNKYAYMT